MRQRRTFRTRDSVIRFTREKEPALRQYLGSAATAAEESRSAPRTRDREP